MSASEPLIRRRTAAERVSYLQGYLAALRAWAVSKETSGERRRALLAEAEFHQQELKRAEREL